MYFFKSFLCKNIFQNKILICICIIWKYSSLKFHMTRSFSGKPDLHGDFNPDIRGRRETLLGGQICIFKTIKQKDQQPLQQEEEKKIFYLERVTILWVMTTSPSPTSGHHYLHVIIINVGSGSYFDWFTLGWCQWKIVSGKNKLKYCTSANILHKEVLIKLYVLHIFSSNYPDGKENHLVPAAMLSTIPFKKKKLDYLCLKNKA